MNMRDASRAQSSTRVEELRSLLDGNSDEAANFGTNAEDNPGVLEVSRVKYPRVVIGIADAVYRRLEVLKCDIEGKGQDEFLRLLAETRQRTVDVDLQRVADEAARFLRSVVEASVSAAPKGFRERVIRPEQHADEVVKQLEFAGDAAVFLEIPEEHADPMRTENLRAFLNENPYRELLDATRDYFWKVALNFASVFYSTLKRAVNLSVVGTVDYDAESRTARIQYFLREFGDERRHNRSGRVSVHVDCVRYDVELINARKVSVAEASAKEVAIPFFVKDIARSAPWLLSLLSIIDGEQTEERVSVVTTTRREVVQEPPRPVFRLDPALVIGEFCLVGWTGVNPRGESRRRLPGLKRAARRQRIVNRLKRYFLAPLSIPLFLIFGVACLMSAPVAAWTAISARLGHISCQPFAISISICVVSGMLTFGAVRLGRWAWGEDDGPFARRDR